MSVKAKATILEWEDAITSIPGVTGIARGGHSPEKIYVFVEKKTPQILTALPKYLNEIPVEIIETGKIRILSQQILEVSRTMRMRPLIGGISCGAPEISAGTLSCKVYDRTTGIAYGLSNCHVFGGNWGTKRDGYRTKPILSPGCLPPGSPIITNFGIIEIDKISEGSRVLGNGKFVKVLKTMKREHKGEMVRVIPHRFIPFDLTPEHPVLVIETNGFRNGQERKRELNSKPIWKRAKDLSKNDFLLIPRIKEYKQAEPIEIIKYRYYCNKCGHSWDTYKKPKQPTCSICYSTDIAYKGTKRKIIDINDPDFAFLLGLFIADGYASSKNGLISIFLDKNDKWNIAKTKWLFSKFFGSCKEHVCKNKNMVLLSFYNIIIRDWFRKNCYLNKEKKLPDFVIYMPDYWIKELIEGLLVGDGYRNKKFGTLLTTSKILAYQLAVLLTKIGVLPSIKIANKKRERMRKHGLSKEKEGYEIICLDKYKKARGSVFNDYITIQIEDIEFYNYEGEVYNLETEDNTYSIPFIVHNSYDGGKLPNDKIGSLYRWVDVDIDKPNIVDAAICTLDVEMSDEVLDIGKLGPPTSVSIGDVVVKSGRTTGITKNTVLALDGVVVVEGWGKAKFIDQIIVNQPWVEGGDSGSVACTTDNRVVGIVFAGSDVVGVVNKASNIERLLNISFTPTPTPAPTIPSLPFSLFGLAAGFGMVISSSFLKYKA
jgi:intein/homing endonuclease